MTNDPKKKNRNRENYSQNESLLTSMYPKGDYIKKEEENHYIIHKDTFDILPIGVF